MANEKRQRQDALRAQKLAEAKVSEEKQRKRGTQKRIAYVALALLALLGVFLLLTRDNSSDSVDTTAAATDAVAPTTTAAPVTTVPLVLPSAISTKPDATLPAGDAPKTLATKDLVVGTGAEVTKGSTVTVNYVGVGFITKKEFDTSWGKAPFPVENVGEAPVIAGWNEGLVGMKEGGRRQLLIPADKAYGAAGFGDVIKPNEPLMFIVDAIKVTPKAS